MSGSEFAVTVLPSITQKVRAVVARGDSEPLLAFDDDPAVVELRQKIQRSRQALDELARSADAGERLVESAVATEQAAGERFDLAAREGADEATVSQRFKELESAQEALRMAKRRFDAINGADAMRQLRQEVVDLEGQLADARERTRKAGIDRVCGLLAVEIGGALEIAALRARAIGVGGGDWVDSRAILRQLGEDGALRRAVVAALEFVSA